MILEHDEQTYEAGDKVSVLIFDDCKKVRIEVEHKFGKNRSCFVSMLF